MKYLSNIGSVWPTRVLVLFLLIITSSMVKDIIDEKKWLVLILPLLFIFSIYLLTKFNSIRYDDKHIYIQNFIRIKVYARTDFKVIEQGIPLPDYYKIIFNNGDSYNFRRGYSQVRFPSFRDRSSKAKEIENELKR